VSFVSFFFFGLSLYQTKGERVKEESDSEIFPLPKRELFQPKIEANKIEKFALGIAITTHIKLE